MLLSGPSRTLPSIVIRRAALAARIEEPIQAEDKSSVARETLETLKHAAKVRCSVSVALSVC